MKNSFHSLASSPINSNLLTTSLLADKAEIVKDEVVEVSTATEEAEISTAVPVAADKAELKSNVETLITEIMAAVVPTIVASIEQKEVTVAVPEVAVVAKTEAVVVIDEALAKKDYLPKSLIKAAEEKVVPAVTEIIAEIVDKVVVPAVAVPVVAVPNVAQVIAKLAEEVKKSEAPLVEIVKTEVKPESSTASSTDFSTTVVL